MFARHFFSSNHIVENHLHKSLPFIKTTQPSLKNLEMDPTTAILAFMGMAGVAYYLYNKPPRLRDSNLTKDLVKDQKDLAKDQMDLTKEQENLIDNLIEDQMDLFKDLKNFTKDKKLIIALAFNLTQDLKDLDSNLSKNLKQLAKDEALNIRVFEDFSEN